MNEHLSTLIIALIFVLGLLAIDSVRGHGAGPATVSALENRD